MLPSTYVAWLCAAWKQVLLPSVFCWSSNKIIGSGPRLQ
jgi:hypothetical protein